MRIEEARNLIKSWGDVNAPNTSMVLTEQVKKLLEAQAVISRAEEQLRLYDSLHQLFMATKDLKSLDLIEKVQQQILNSNLDDWM